ncbi:hypothetical protein SLS53_002476 [Cytospora paraplurivora]|uniref:Uncharacterized protein n=1 Tax=Cytospora paraplurivora TaxID=2898453 RepID=A0AAN9UGW0_9PEZI
MKLQLKDLTFEGGRGPVAAAIEQLTDVFLSSCNPDEKANQIPVVVSPEELHDLITVSGTSMQDLIRSMHAPFPRLQPSKPLRCIHGRQRYEAAKRIEGPEMWWTVRLYCIVAGSDLTRLLYHEVDQHYFQTAPYDGYVFRKVREYDESGEPDKADDWRRRLSKGKKNALRAIETRPEVLEIFDQLRCIPGLWEGLHLGNIERHLALHATEEMLHYLRHTQQVWATITLQDPLVQQATDIATVQALELRAPAASTEDAAAVRRLMSSGEFVTN